MNAASDTIENFYGVYLLYCFNPKYKGRTYIGYTVDPNRRIKQHNKGAKAGGAWKTSKKGPWSMVLIVHGFPNDITALRFEWAWQHPHLSRRLNTVIKKKPHKLSYDFQLQVLSEMLRVGPWNRLPLTIRWLNEEYQRDFPIEKTPPIHMPITNGAVISKKVSYTKETEQKDTDNEEYITCLLCFKFIENKKMTCLNPICDLISHVTCLSGHYLEDGEYVPVEGKCPRCNKNFLWGDIVRKYKGCYSNLNIEINSQMANDFYSSDSE